VPVFSGAAASKSLMSLRSRSPSCDPRPDRSTRGGASCLWPDIYKHAIHMNQMLECSRGCVLLRLIDTKSAVVCDTTSECFCMTADSLYQAAMLGSLSLSGEGGGGGGGDNLLQSQPHNYQTQSVCLCMPRLRGEASIKCYTQSIKQSMAQHASSCTDMLISTSAVRCHKL